MGRICKYFFNNRKLLSNYFQVEIDNYIANKQRIYVNDDYDTLVNQENYFYNIEVSY